MFDRQGINRRYFSCFSGLTPLELSKKLDLSHPTVYQWVAGVRQVPWNRLKDLVDAERISWDWLLEGKSPKHRSRSGDDGAVPFDRHAINQRFLALFPGMSQANVGSVLGVSQMSVYRWHHALSQVPWEKLKFAVDTLGTTWDWLLEGYGHDAQCH
jgi:hypothetical protein